MKLTAEQVSERLQREGYNQAKVHQFICWKKSCPEVWQNFERITLELIEQGKRAGTIDILARVRWECEIIGGKDYKCNNNYAPMLGRVFVYKYPQHTDFFNFREVGQQREAA